MFKKVCLVGLAAAAFSFAQEETYVRNICDTLSGTVNLRMAYVEETGWFGAKDLSKTDSSFVKRFKDFESLVPFRKKFGEQIPVYMTAGCNESKGNAFRYAKWEDEKWVVSGEKENLDYATYIMDNNINQLKGYDPKVYYNFVAFVKGSLPADDDYPVENLMASKSFELKFDWWYTVAAYKIDKIFEEDGQTKKTTSWKLASTIALDSAESVEAAVNGLEKPNPDTVSKVQYHQIHVVLMDERKIPSDEEIFSSSSVETSSSSSEAESSSSEASSSSSGTTAIGRLVNAPRAFKAREIRRLDGTRIKAGEFLAPGVYYVKGVDGRWKKQVELQ